MNPSNPVPAPADLEEYDPFAEFEEPESAKIERVMLSNSGPSSEVIKMTVFRFQANNGEEAVDGFSINLPLRLQMYCPDEACERPQFHDWLRPRMHGFLGIKPAAKVVDLARICSVYAIEYRCSNCRHSTKSILLECNFASGEVRKVGEIPPEGAPIPRRLLDLVDPYGSLLIKGYQLEQRGYGVGAYAYYRRVVEQERSAFLGEVKKVAKQRGASAAVISQIDRAIANRSFERSMDQIKGAVPRELYIGSENPFTLLHDALSKGLHGMDDAECLAIAEVVREVLTEFAEKSTTILREPKKLQAAVAAIRKATAPK